MLRGVGPASRGFLEACSLLATIFRCSLGCWLLRRCGPVLIRCVVPCCVRCSASRSVIRWVGPSCRSRAVRKNACFLGMSTTYNTVNVFERVLGGLAHDRSTSFRRRRLRLPVLDPFPVSYVDTRVVSVSAALDTSSSCRVVLSHLGSLCAPAARLGDPCTVP